MTKYDLSDLGYKYRGIASKKSKSTKFRGWNIIDIPDDVDVNEAVKFVERFIRGICALEIPTSLICNLRCNYCYIEDPRMKTKHVDPEIVERILTDMSNLFPGFSTDESVRKQVGKGHVYLAAWGAEPLANVHTMEVLQKFGRKNYPKSYTFNTSTNATLWSPKIEEVFENLIEDEAFNGIQVSLDGPKWLQDSQRPDTKGQGTFDRVEQFCKNIVELAKKHKYKKFPYSLCSTIHLTDENFAENWVAALDFFSTPNKWYTCTHHLPMRMSGEDLSNEEHIKRFCNAQKLVYEKILEKAKQGITVADFYTSKLFGTSSNIRTRNGFTYCSALNTQIGVDIDGSMYPCHGPITSPTYKPFLWYGNLFDRVISYKQLVRNFSYQYGTLWTKGKCVGCPINEYATGNICWSCPSHNLALSNEPSIDSALKCVAFEESFKYWIAIAKLTIDNPTLKNIPKDWFNDIEVPDTPNKKLPFNINSIHFDPKYNNQVAKGLDKWHGYSKDHEDCSLIDSWWVFDNFNEVI